jgi:hypothetical protein
MMSTDTIPTACFKSHTRMRQTATPFLVRVQNKDLRGLGERYMIGSGGRFGRAGTVESCLAADVGKYMILRIRKSRE